MWIWMVATLAPIKKMVGREGGMGKEKKSGLGNVRKNGRQVGEGEWGKKKTNGDGG